MADVTHEMNDATPLSSGEITASHRLVLLEPDASSLQNATVNAFTAYLSGVLGTGTGGDIQLAPELPATADINVPLNRPVASIVAFVGSVVKASPEPTWSMQTSAGLSILTDSGDVTLTNSASFFDPLIDTVTGEITSVDIVVTASNAVGNSSCTITLTPVPDYDGVPTTYDANRVLDYNFLDQRNVRYDATKAVVTQVFDNSPEGRNGTNTQEKLGWAQLSNLGPNRPAVRNNGAKGQTTGMFFNQNPLWWGIRSTSLSTNALNDFVTLQIDKMYKNTNVLMSPNESSLQDVKLTFDKNALVGKISLLTIAVQGDTITYRLNGTQIGTLTLNSYNQPIQPVLLFALIYSNTISGTNSIFSVSALAQSRSWKDAAFNGDIGRLLMYQNIGTSAIAPPPPPTTSTSDLLMTDSDVSAADAATYTFTGLDIGTADVDRLVIACLTFRASGTPTITSVTIGGIEATIDVDSRNTSNNLSAASIRHASVPLGTTADVVVTLSGNAVLMGVVVYTTTVYDGSAPTKTGTATRGDTAGTMQLTLNTPDTGFQIAVATSFGGTNRKITTASAKDGAIGVAVVNCANNAATWTGLVEDSEVTMEAGAGAVMAACIAGWKIP